MGEILRAICDASCVYSAPAFYTGEFISPMTAGARTYAERKSVLQLKADTFFLLMGFTQDIAIGPPTGLVWEQKVAASSFLIQDLKNSRTYANLPLLKSNAGYNMNNIITLATYILFEPASLIGITQTVPITDATGAVQSNSYVTLSGIEYQMPAGRA